MDLHWNSISPFGAMGDEMSDTPLSEKIFDFIFPKIAGASIMALVVGFITFVIGVGFWVGFGLTMLILTMMTVFYYGMVLFFD